jgi:uncharacterized membrane protein
MNEYHPMPQPSDIPIREKEDAMGAYLMMFAALGAGLPLPFINVLASVIYYFIHRKHGPFVKFHLIQSLWSQLPLSLLNGVIVVWTIRNFMQNEGFDNLYLGLLLSVIVFNIIYIIFSLIAAMQARQGRMYYFVFFGRLAYELAFKVNENDLNEDKNHYHNLPPD